jgi:hypothetical protein
MYTFVYTVMVKCIWLCEQVAQQLHYTTIIQLAYMCDFMCDYIATNYIEWHVWSSHMFTFPQSIWNDTFNFYTINFQLNLPMIHQLLPLGFHYVNITNPPIWDFCSTSIWLVIDYVATIVL